VAFGHVSQASGDVRMASQPEGVDRQDAQAGDVGVSVEAMEVERGAAQHGHDLRSGAGADPRGVFILGDVADVCAVRRCCFEWRWKTFVAVPVAAGRWS